MLQTCLVWECLTPEALIEGRLISVKMQWIMLDMRWNNSWNGYLRKGQKTKPKRQNQTRNGKAWKRQSQDKAQ
ncbi:hypothetical protein Tco_0642818, partial [Tanacetum coccineum]